MTFAPVEELIEEIAAGRMIVVVDDEDRENEGDLIMAASKVRPEDINFMAKHARGLICLSITRERCEQLGLGPMVRENRSQHHTNFTVSIEAAQGVTTGISAYDRAHTIRTAVQPDAKPSDLHQPGHVFPLMSQPGGVLARTGHTEAASDFALLAGLEPAGVLVEIMNDDGSMARRPQLEVFAREHGLKMGSIADLIAWRSARTLTVERVDDRVEQTSFGAFRIVSYRDQLNEDTHFAMICGDAPHADQPTLVRVHVHDPLADLLHLDREDISMPLGHALSQVADAGQGIVLVLASDQPSEQLLQRLHGNTTTHNDAKRWRRSGLGAQILADLGCQQLEVIGSPRKYPGLSGFGLEVVGYRRSKQHSAAESDVAEQAA